MPPASPNKKQKSKTTMAGFKSSALRISRGGGDASDSAVADDLDDWKKGKTLLKPDDQLELTDAERKEELARVLSTKNTQQQLSLVQYNYKKGSFVPLPPGADTIVFLNIKGICIPRDCEEARQQMIEEGLDPNEFMDESSILDESIYTQTTQEKMLEEQKPEETEVAGEDVEEGDEEKQDEEKHDEEKPEEEEKAQEDDKGEPDEDEPAPTKPKKITNQFNFCERAALTFVSPVRTVETQTVPPPSGTFSGYVLQWIIYDAYLKDFEEQQREKEKEDRRLKARKKPKKQHKTQHLSEAIQKKIGRALKVLERMVNLNTFDDIAQDYRYWEDPSDEYRETDGTLLPLWKFNYEKTKKMMITDLSWNPWYYDLFAVTFGSLDFTKQFNEGAVCLFTIKNPSYPEHICMTDSSVMCVDIHSKYPYFVVIGLYNGNVQVYNVQETCKEPQYVSNAVTDKHAGIVWEVKWGPDLQDGEMNFYSVSGDGKINNWVLMPSHLSITTVIILYLATDIVPGPDGTLIKMKGCGSTMVFHPDDPSIFMVGTEEGLIYKCSTAYSSMYLLTYFAHDMPVYRIDFNKFNSDIFITCSGDWRIKIWEDNRLDPLFVFDLGSCVGDVKWAPYSSTVFGAVTNEGKVYVFDLNVNKYNAICTQAVVSRRRNKLTRIAFNSKLPIIIVGDDKGCITTLKLSPNLRLPCKQAKKAAFVDQDTLQIMKLDKLLALVREPKKLDRPPDTTETEDS